MRLHMKSLKLIESGVPDNNNSVKLIDILSFSVISITTIHHKSVITLLVPLIKERSGVVKRLPIDQRERAIKFNWRVLYSVSTHLRITSPTQSSPRFLLYI